jgi:pimeloyl-ACP methyl ester carboxylesterase
MRSARLTCCALLTLALAYAQNAEWLGFHQGSEQILVYTNHPLNTANPAIRRALVVIHGGGRDAEPSLNQGITAAAKAGVSDETLVVAPRFASNQGGDCLDEIDPGEVNWNCDNWRAGGLAPESEGLTSFDVTDEILLRLADRTVFPNLKTIVVAGHSAGGQYVTRYAMANRVHEKIAGQGIALSYVVANPSSYAYPDPERPNAEGEKCAPYFNNWPYGLDRRTDYVGKVTAAQLLAQLIGRPVTYLLGELDTQANAGLDQSCPANAQGPYRRARGEAFFAMVTLKYHAPHHMALIPGCGHNARCMFSSEKALPALFPKP